ncbi:MAG TPA: hypothetical protein VGC62_15095 [Pseudomonas sp.]|uniref:hypothetical protein n=1 Tax=Pseudomonas sp. TaxID=306 RepID=UPI002EDB43CC
MNTQRLARLRIAPLHVQQGLFASLALMVTLIAAQQFNRWNQDQEVTQIDPAYSRSALLAKAPVLQAREVALSFQPVDEKAPAVDQTPRQQSWVF